MDKKEIAEGLLLKVYVMELAFTAKLARPFLNNKLLGDTDLFETKTIHGYTL